LAVLVAAVVGSLIGGIWYSWAPLWKALKAARDETEDNPVPGEASNRFFVRVIRNFGAAFFMNLIAAFIIAVLLGIVRIAENSFFNFPSGAEAGATIGVIIWFASLATTVGSSAISERSLDKGLGINLAGSLVSYLAIGVIVGTLLDVAPLVAP